MKTLLTNNDIDAAPIGSKVTNGTITATRISENVWSYILGGITYTVSQSRMYPTTKSKTLTGKVVKVVNAEWSAA